MVHPVDEEGKWQYILEMNIIKALGQLFVIQKVDEVQQGGSRYVSCYAEHITYTLNDKWIFPPVTIAGYTGQTLIDNMLSQATDLGYDWQTTYTFTVTSDMSLPENFEDWTELAEGVTPYEMLLGGDGFVAKVGGELYRDNFTMKINERMYGAQDDAFEIAVGYNLTGIHRTVDLTTFCTYLRGYDVSLGEDYGDPYSMWWAIGWDPSTLPRPYPREVVRSKNFTFPDTLGEYRYDRLARATGAFFDSQCAPLITYELNIVDLKRNPDYSKFTNNYRYKVGDKGKVWDERLQSWVILEITRTEKDGITGDTTKVVIGTMRDFTRPVGYNPVIPRTTIIIPRTAKIIEGVPPITFSTSETQLEDWEIYGAEGGVGEASTSLNLYPPINNNSINRGYWGIYPDGGLYGEPCYNTTEAWTPLCNPIYLDIGTYTFSVYVKADRELEPAEGSAFSDYPTVLYWQGQSGWPNYDQSATAEGAAVYTGVSTTFVRKQITFTVTSAGYVYPYIQRRALNVGNIYTTCFQLESGSIATPYTAYSDTIYYIPVKITSATQTYYKTADDKLFADSTGALYLLADEHPYTIINIPIEAPLGANEVISRAETGIEIPTYNGQNVLSVETEVQPEKVKIWFKESI